MWPALGRATPVRPERVRLRELGIVIGELATGPYNAITDVEGVRVGHVTLIEDGGPVRTGVTAIVPRTPAFAADFTLNGNGELMGVGSMRRTGLLAGPVLFTNTSSVGAVYDGGGGVDAGARSRPVQKRFAARAHSRRDMGCVSPRRDRAARAACTRGRGSRRSARRAGSRRLRWRRDRDAGL